MNEATTSYCSTSLFTGRLITATAYPTRLPGSCSPEVSRPSGRFPRRSSAHTFTRTHAHTVWYGTHAHTVWYIYPAQPCHSPVTNPVTILFYTYIPYGTYAHTRVHIICIHTYPILSRGARPFVPTPFACAVPRSAGYPFATRKTYRTLRTVARKTYRTLQAMCHVPRPPVNALEPEPYHGSKQSLSAPQK